MTPEQKARRDALAEAHADSFGTIITTEDLAYATIRKCSFKKGYDSCFQEAEKLVAALENHLKHNDCDCGWEEPIGEGFTSGVCFLHEALQSWREWAK